MIRMTAPGTIFLLLLCTCAYGQELAEGIIHSERLFYTGQVEGVACYRIPALATAPNGDLIAAIDERVPSCDDLRGSDDINIVMRRSMNNGISWGSIEKIVDFPPGQSASDPSMIVDQVTQEIFLFYNFMDLQKEKDVYYLHLISSKDNGETWSDPVDITDQISKPAWHHDFKFITSGRGMQTKSGKLLHCMVNLEKGMHVFGSDDHGTTWYLIDTPIVPGDESKIVELSDGRWMINSRVNTGDKRYVHISDDEGKTWKSAASDVLIDPHCNASIISYSMGNESILLFSNASSTIDRSNLKVRISYDDGETWSEGRTIYTGSAAYSSMTLLENGDIGIFFEKDDYTENVFASFTLDWLKMNE